HLNGHPTQRLAGNLNLSVEGVDGAALLLGLQPIMAVSSGSACSSTSTAPSHVLTALGHSEKLAYAAVRFGIGRFNTAEEIDTVAQQVISTVQSLQQIESKSGQSLQQIESKSGQDARTTRG
ncbi:aminotransferase class V-fold PLP-dependent enzyme, partial [Nodularia sp. UHCC 0506]|uniref:aminotransferase class V-fold PLP-dependent enzyme n=1 Tax=Nodularia sp. UHCC 0506 TaxID=3110243 RepID=UPI002B1F1039